MTKIVEPMTDERIKELRAMHTPAINESRDVAECLDEIEMLRKEAAATADELLGAGALAPVYASIVRGDRDGYKAKAARLQDECDQLRSVVAALESRVAHWRQRAEYAERDLDANTDEA